MQAQIHEVGGQLLYQRPFAGGVGNHEGDTVLAKQVDKILLKKARMADFHRVAQGCAVGAARRWRVIEALALPGALHGLADIAREQGKELGKQAGVILEAGWKLPEEGPQFVLQLQWPRGIEVGHGLAHIPQALDVGDIAWCLDAENEVVRRIVAPAGIAFRGVQRVEGAVDLDAADGAGGKRQFTALYQSLGVEVAPPGSVAPT